MENTDTDEFMKDYTMSTVIQECNSIVFIKGYMLFIN